MACVAPTVSLTRESPLSHVDRPRTPNLDSKGGTVPPRPAAGMAYATPKLDSADLANPTTPGPAPEPPQHHKAEDLKAVAPAVKPEEDDDLYLHTEPKVVKCTWEKFKNRFQNAYNKTGFEIASVELLMTSETLDEDIEVERLRRMDKTRREKYLAGYRRPTQPRHAATWTSELPFERIRINSSIVNKYLARVSGNSSWPVQPHTFLIPFAFLIHHHGKMKAELKNLEDRFGPTRPGEMDDGAKVQPREVKPLSKDEALEAAMVSKDAYLQMKCYVDFVDANLIPHYSRFDDASHSNPKKIRFDDLWCLFRYGELLCRPNNSAAVRRHDRAALFDRLYFSGGDDLRLASNGPSGGASASVESHTIVRAKWIGIPPHKWEVNADEYSEDGDYRGMSSRGSVSVESFYLDYDGTRFAPVTTYIDIPFFRGEMEINKLPIFPIRFLRNEKSLSEQLRNRGRQFRDIVMKARGGQEVFTYDGWSLTTSPLGNPLPVPPWERNFMGIAWETEIQPEYVSSDIIVDFQEAYQTTPAWRPDFDTTEAHVDTMPDVLYESFSIMCWTDESREKEVKKVRELVVADDRVESVLWNNLLQTDPLCSSEPNDDTTAEKQTLADRDLVLLPSRVMAYALRDRKFFNAHVSVVREVIWPPEHTSPFNSLKINPGHKDMILSIVHEHFDKKRLAAQLQQLQQLDASSGGKGGDSGDQLTLPDQDFIRGKGKGLVILLHGSPGVGKTATAEAVALSRRRPLFLITSGDLGTTTWTVERGLRQIFRLANLWNCILLLDEADIFLSQREKGDESIERNAMVSIFLRTLEYYPGILFLTTNRPGVLDEAIKSRVHVSLQYPAFDLDQTLELFKINIGRLEDIEKARVKAQRTSKGSASHMMTIRRDEILDFAKKHFNGDESLRWNGRQIRNAFQIAASLAHFEHQERVSETRNGVTAHPSDEDTDGRRRAPYIGKRHFKKVAQVTAEFDKMRQQLVRMTDSELAFNRTERMPDSYPDGQYEVGWHGPRHHNMGGRDDGRRGDTGDRRLAGAGRHDRAAPLRAGSYYDGSYPDDGYHGNRVRFGERYQSERYPGGEGYRGGGGRGGRGGAGGDYRGGGYAEDGSASPSPRRNGHRDRSPYERDRGRRDERARSVSRSRSRSSSGSEPEARHHARDGSKRRRQPTRASGSAADETSKGTAGARDPGRRSGEKSGAGGDSDKYGRRRPE